MKVTDLKSWKTRSLLLGGALVIGVGGSFAIAQARRAPRDPSTMAEFHGKVAQYDLTPRGDIDGLILADGAEVHFPPHLGSEVQAAVHPGDDVTIRGDKEGPVVRAGSIAVGSGAPIVDRGPPPGGPQGEPQGGPAGGPRGGPRDNGVARQALTDTGVVKMALHGPRGELNGVLLEDGTMVHLPPPEATRLADTLKPGQPIAVRGEGVDGPTGRSIGAREVGPSMDKLTTIALPPPPPRGGPDGRGPDGRGPDGHRQGPGVPKPNNI